MTPTPKDKSFYDTYFAHDPEYSKPYKDSIYYDMWYKVMLLLKTYAVKHVISLGCGPGQFAAMLRDKCPIGYIGVDFSTEAIKMARANNAGTRFIECDFMSSFDRIKYRITDSVVILETLEHVDDVALITMIPAGTKIFFTVPNFDADAHMRTYNSVNYILERLGGLIEFHHCEKFQAFYICVGERK